MLLYLFLGTMRFRTIKQLKYIPEEDTAVGNVPMSLLPNSFLSCFCCVHYFCSLLPPLAHTHAQTHTPTLISLLTAVIWKKQGIAMKINKQTSPFNHLNYCKRKHKSETSFDLLVSRINFSASTTARVQVWAAGQVSILPALGRNLHASFSGATWRQEVGLKETGGWRGGKEMSRYTKTDPKT